MSGRREGIQTGTWEAVSIVQLPTEQLQAMPANRDGYRDEQLAALAESLLRDGPLQALLVRPLSDGSYAIIAGSRRWHAARLAGLRHLPCRVLDVDEDRAFVLGLIENVHRRELGALEEAQAYQELLDRGIVRNRAGIARLVGVTRMRITQRMRLLDLDEWTQTALAEHSDVLTEYHGRLLCAVRSTAARQQLVLQAVDGRWSGARLRQEIERLAIAEDQHGWVSGDRYFPRSYSIALPGFRVSISFRRADLRQVRDTLARLEAEVQSFLSTPAVQLRVPAKDP